MERFVGVEDAHGSLGQLVDDVAAGGDVVTLTKERGKPLAVPGEPRGVHAAEACRDRPST